MDRALGVGARSGNAAGLYRRIWGRSPISYFTYFRATFQLETG
jgi:hypothetical protein